MSSKHSINFKHLRTSIGKSVNTRPRNKRKRRAWKKYRRQGK